MERQLELGGNTVILFITVNYTGIIREFQYFFIIFSRRNQQFRQLELPDDVQ